MCPKHCVPKKTPADFTPRPQVPGLYAALFHPELMTTLYRLQIHWGADTQNSGMPALVWGFRLGKVGWTLKRTSWRRRPRCSRPVGVAVAPALGGGARQGPSSCGCPLASCPFLRPARKAFTQASQTKCTPDSWWSCEDAELIHQLWNGA